KSPAGLGLDHAEARHRVPGPAGEFARALRGVAAQDSRDWRTAAHLAAQDLQQRRPDHVCGCVDTLTVLIDVRQLLDRRVIPHLALRAKTTRPLSSTAPRPASSGRAASVRATSCGRAARAREVLAPVSLHKGRSAAMTPPMGGTAPTIPVRNPALPLD